MRANNTRERRIALAAAIFCLAPAASANAGPANRQAGATIHGKPAAIYTDGFGAPLTAVARNPNDLQIFANGQENFKELETLPEVGPIFNGISCAGCHSQPAIGGGGLFINEIRVRNNTASGPLHIFAVDNMLRMGPQSQGTTAIFPNGVQAEPLGCQITVPGCQLSACQQEEAARTTFSTDLNACDPTSAAFTGGANCTAGRASNPTFGLGLVEAVADSTFIKLAAAEPSSVRGMVKQISELGKTRVARFGWKDDHATLRAFASDAYLNEMGITNPDNPNEISSCALGVTQYGIPLQVADDPEDTTDPDGRADIDRFADFMRAAAPPPELPPSPSAKNGAFQFVKLGCAGCHTPSLTTDRNPASFIPATTGGIAITPSLNKTLAGQTFFPFSDFLLHDMGSLGDGITSGTAGPTMMRTEPLWGIRAKSVFLHDGRAADIPTAITLHDGQGAKASTGFKLLTSQQQQDLVNFLMTL